MFVSEFSSKFIVLTRICKAKLLSIGDNNGRWCVKMDKLVYDLPLVVFGLAISSSLWFMILSFIWFNCGRLENTPFLDFVWQGQIKLKETALEASASSFAEKERDLQNKIEELVSRLEELNQNSAIFCYNQPQKVSNYM
jgi:hypothetical protein